MGGAAAAAGHELILLIGGLIGLVLFGRFVWRHFDHPATPGQRVGGGVALLGLSALIVIIVVAVVAVNAS
jgi:hypothetical protein